MVRDMGFVQTRTFREFLRCLFDPCEYFIILGTDVRVSFLVRARVKERPTCGVHRR